MTDSGLIVTSWYENPPAIVRIFICRALACSSALARLPDQLVLERIDEPVEKAFTILKPRGWEVEGGITRWDPVAMGGAANAIEAKIDFALKSDPSGTIMIHWLPDIYFVDMTGSMAAGMFPEGSFYNGMPVLHKMDAPTFLQSHVAPYLHPKPASSPSTAPRPLPEIDKLCHETDLAKQLQSQYSAAVADFSYTENGVRYRERAFCIIQDMGPLHGRNVEKPKHRGGKGPRSYLSGLGAPVS
jgi:hypothetical protein